MINNIIEWSIKNRVMVLLLTALFSVMGIVSVRSTALDALPDLSDAQVIIKTTYPGQTPQVVEDQVTYPLSTAMLSVQGAETVRGYSFFGDSYVYVIFKEGTNLDWARSRVLEYFSQVAGRLPAEAQPSLGPNATGVGWIYEYALVDRSGKHDIAALRAVQDWYLKYGLQNVPGVAEVANLGGMVRQYQVVLDPNRLRAYNLSLTTVRNAIVNANRESGGSVIEMAEAEYIVRTTGYIKSISDLQNVPLGVSDQGTPILLKEVAEVRFGPQMRRGIAELNGEGEVAGAIVVMRSGENALATIQAVKAKIARLKAGLPKGVEIVETYDRSELIHRAVSNLQITLLEEFVVVAIVCAVFLFHLRSTLVVIISLPVGILVAFIIMKAQGINANIMSLGGVAIAIGVMVDAAIVMIENVHKHLEHNEVDDENRWQIIASAAREVGPSLFYALLIITLSFLPVFALEAQEGRLFAPLAFTKTYAMAAAAGLSITLVPVLMGYFIRGRIISEQQNPVSRGLIRLYRPFIEYALNKPKRIIHIALIITLSMVLPMCGFKGLLEPLHWPVAAVGLMVGDAPPGGVRDRYMQTVTAWQQGMEDFWKNGVPGSIFYACDQLGLDQKGFCKRVAGVWPKKLGGGLGSEFMPDLDEGDLMYMPTTFPAVSIGHAQQILQLTDKLIKSVPEVKTVFGKIGRAETATDPAPFNMIETTIVFKPRDQWRPGMTPEKLRAELNRVVRLPGIANAWVMPIKTRIDMLATGIKTPVGVKISGPDLKVIETIGKRVEEVIQKVPGTLSAFSERAVGGRYITVDLDRRAAARYGLNIHDVQEVVGLAVGGTNISETVENRQRFPINLRYPNHFRDSLTALTNLPLVTPSGAHIRLADVAKLRIEDGPDMVRSENAQLIGWVYVDIKDRDLGSYVNEARRVVDLHVTLPLGYSIDWAGQYQYLVRAKNRMMWVVPFTLGIILLLLYLNFRNSVEVAIIVVTLPLALAGGYWLLFFLDYNTSVAVTVGFIALAGLAVETGMIMLMYLNLALHRRIQENTAQGSKLTLQDLRAAVIEGALLRVRPKIMTVAAILAGLIPIMFSSGTGSEVMRRIAAPMLGGVVSSTLLTLVLIPVVFYLWKQKTLFRTSVHNV